MAPFFCAGCFSCLHGTVRPASCIRVFGWLCKLHTIEDHVLCHATVVSRTDLLKAEESRASARTYCCCCTVVLYWGVCYVQDIMLYCMLESLSCCHPHHTTHCYYDDWSGTPPPRIGYQVDKTRVGGDLVSTDGIVFFILYVSTSWAKISHGNVSIIWLCSTGDPKYCIKIRRTYVPMGEKL